MHGTTGFEEQPVAFSDIMQHEYANPFGAALSEAMAKNLSVSEKRMWYDSGRGYHIPPNPHILLLTAQFWNRLLR